MVGGGNRRDEGTFTVSNTNVFAALETLRKKKKSDKGSSKGSTRSSKTGAASGKSKQAEEKPVYWAPAPLTVKSWADVDDEDDDDYYATTAPPQAIWGGTGLNKVDEREKQDHLEESEIEDEPLDEGDDDVEEEPDPETEVGEPSEPIGDTQVELLSPAPKETERQLSKKERRKKELAELEAILADFGVNPKEKAEDENDVNKDGKGGQLNGVAEKKDTAAPAESKSAKKKKKKDKASKEVKEPNDQSNTSDAPIEQHETEHVEGDASTVDVKGRLKKVASAKKKKSNKEVDAAARAAAMEAAARSAKLAVAKKKEKNHYNQQPIR